MNIEIERKFLLRNEGWRDEAVGVERLRDGLVGESGGGKVRVRLGETRASLAVKTASVGLARWEFEYCIPPSDAEMMLATMCGDMVVEKLRYRVMHAGFEWAVDLYEKRLAGIAIAEIELDHPDQNVPLPPWVGREVTADQRFHKRNMARLSLASDAPLTVARLLALPVREPAPA
jgi:CYTH domain-containing protein